MFASQKTHNRFNVFTESINVPPQKERARYDVTLIKSMESIGALSSYLKSLFVLTKVSKEKQFNYHFDYDYSFVCF